MRNQYSDGTIERFEFCNVISKAILAFAALLQSVFLVHMTLVFFSRFIMVGAVSIPLSRGFVSLI